MKINTLFFVAILVLSLFAVGCTQQYSEQQVPIVETIDSADVSDVQISDDIAVSEVQLVSEDDIVEIGEMI
jgi:hypothetical protein